MTRDHSFRTHWPAWLLTAALLVTAGLPGAVIGAAAAEAEPSAEPSAGPDASLATEPEASLLPTFDPTAAPIRIDLFRDGLEAPVYLTDDGTGSPCVYVVERGGKVWMLDTADGFLRPRPFLDLSSRVRVGAEQGLHTIAFHPGFRRNGRVFAHYNDVTTGNSVIAEFKGAPCKPARNRPVKTVLTVEQPFPNNNGGWIGFGPDGFLYILLGDGGGVSPGDPNGYGQNASTRLSKVLRIDVNRGRLYANPPDNPYAKRPRGFPRETWAMGLRDPRRASFDRETGDLWIGDKGQDRFEEVNRIPAGEAPLNFGWSHMEGELCHNLPDCDPSQYTLPAYFYDQVPPHGGITGGYVYRGSSIPGLRGVYVFGDIISGFIWGLDAAAVAAGQPVTAHVLLDAPKGFVSFGEDDDGELYALTLDGSVYRIKSEDA